MTMNVAHCILIFEGLAILILLIGLIRWLMSLYKRLKRVSCSKTNPCKDCTMDISWCRCCPFVKEVVKESEGYDNKV